MSQLDLSDLEEGESYYDKDNDGYAFDTYTLDKHAPYDYWIHNKNGMLVIMERHPADQNTESKSIQVVYKRNMEDITVTDILNISNMPLRQPNKYPSVKDELLDHTAEIVESLCYDTISVSQINTSGTAFEVSVREVDGGEYTLVIE